MGRGAWWVWAHDLGAVLWLGSVLYQLMVVAPVLAGEAPPQRRRLWLELIGRFHHLAACAAAAVVLSGLARVLALPWDPARLPGTGYGRLLLGKMAGALGMLVTGGAISLGVTRMLRRPAGKATQAAGLRWLVALLAVEAACGVAVLWCVARIHGG